MTIPQQRAVAAHRVVTRPAQPEPTAWGRTVLLTLLAGAAGMLVQQSLVDLIGWASVVPGLALAGLVAWGGGR